MIEQILETLRHKLSVVLVGNWLLSAYRARSNSGYNQRAIAQNLGNSGLAVSLDRHEDVTVEKIAEAT